MSGPVEALLVSTSVVPAGRLILSAWTILWLDWPLMWSFCQLVGEGEKRLSGSAASRLESHARVSSSCLFMPAILTHVYHVWPCVEMDQP